MTYSSKLIATQNLQNWPPIPRLSREAVDAIVDARERREVRNRTVCNVCFELKSVSGSCQCNYAE